MNRKYLNNFIMEEDGVEIIEWISVLAVAAILIAIAAKCGTAIKAKMSNLASAI